MKACQWILERLKESNYPRGEEEKEMKKESEPSKVIYLQDWNGPEPTWCKDRIDEGDTPDVKYIRDDLNSTLMKALRGLLTMVSNVLTDSQLDHEQCGKTIRSVLKPAFEALAAIPEGDKDEE